MPLSREEQDKSNQINRDWSKTPKGRKCYRKKLWKKRGLNMDTFYYVYPIYLNTTHCDRCNVLLNDDKNSPQQKVLDHCHSTGMFRNIVCRNCNMNVIPHIGKFI